MDFVVARIEKMMDSAIAKDIKEATLASSTYVVGTMLEASQALATKSKDAGYKAAVESLSRVFNLAEKADTSATANPSLFENDEEKALHDAIETLELSADMTENLDKLFALSPVIDAFFDNTMVMAEDEALKNNRLALLSSLVAKASQVAAFNKLNTK